jgi:hypothetical protein
VTATGAPSHLGVALVATGATGKGNHMIIGTDAEVARAALNDEQPLGGEHGRVLRTRDPELKGIHRALSAALNALAPGTL